MTLICFLQLQLNRNIFADPAETLPPTYNPRYTHRHTHTRTTTTAATTSLLIFLLQSCVHPFLKTHFPRKLHVFWGEYSPHSSKYKCTHTRKVALTWEQMGLHSNPSSAPFCWGGQSLSLSET